MGKFWKRKYPPAKNGKKTCRTCDITKSAKEFYNNPSAVDGLFASCKVCTSKRACLWRKKNAERWKDIARNSKIKCKYNIDEEQYRAIISEQNNSCACCGQSFANLGRRQIHVDHCHKTGEVRGITCYNCNLAIGHLGDSVTTAKKLVKYLKRYS